MKFTIQKIYLSNSSLVKFKQEWLKKCFEI